MSFGLEVRDDDGGISFQETGQYGRVVDVFNPAQVGIPGSRSYSDSFGEIQATVKQGGGRVISVNVDGLSVVWSYADNLTWPEMGGTPQIYVTQLARP